MIKAIGEAGQGRPVECRIPRSSLTRTGPDPDIAAPSPASHTYREPLHIEAPQLGCPRIAVSVASGRPVAPVRVSPVSLSRESRSDSAIRVRPQPRQRGARPPLPQVRSFDGEWNRFKNTSKNNMLRGRCDHICVLFVQHPPENKLRGPVSKRSLVVCARTFGNCD